MDVLWVVIATMLVAVFVARWLYLQYCLWTGIVNIGDDGRPTFNVREPPPIREAITAALTEQKPEQITSSSEPKSEPKKDEQKPVLTGSAAVEPVSQTGSEPVAEPVRSGELIGYLPALASAVKKLPADKLTDVIEQIPPRLLTEALSDLPDQVRWELIVGLLALQRNDSGTHRWSANEITAFVGGAAATAKKEIASWRPLPATILVNGKKLEDEG